MDQETYVEDFSRIRYIPAAYNIFTAESDHQKAYDSGLEEARVLLESMIEEINEYWKDDREPVGLSHTRSDAPDGSNEVFVVHGRNVEARKALFEFLRSIGLHPLEWSEAVKSTGKPAPYIGDILNSVFSRAHAVVVLFTPDDEARLKEQFRADSDPPHETELTGQARPNVLFEAGMAMARHQDRTVLVELGTLRPFSDTAGRHAIRMDNSTPRRQDLAQRLEIAGCPVNLNGRDWHTAGDFESTVANPLQAPTDANVEDQELPNEATTLLLEATNDSRGLITRVATMGGLSIETNGREFCESRDPRSEAAWTGALETLVYEDLVEARGEQGTVFAVTHKGFKYADGLEHSEA